MQRCKLRTCISSIMCIIMGVCITHGPLRDTRSIIKLLSVREGNVYWKTTYAVKGMGDVYHGCSCVQYTVCVMCVVCVIDNLNCYFFVD